MGQAMTRLGQMIVGKEMLVVSVVGLGFAGKSTIVHHLKTGQFADFSTATIGFNIDTVEFNDFSLCVYDVGGQTKILLRDFLLRAHGIVFVVDSTNKERIIEARDTLHSFLSKDEAKDKPLLVIANKQDLPNAMSVYEITEKLDLHALRVRCCHVQRTCAVSGEGIRDGFDKLCRTMTGKGII